MSKYAHDSPLPRSQAGRKEKCLIKKSRKAAAGNDRLTVFLRGSPRRNTVSRSFSAAAFLDFLIRRFSLMDRPGFLATDCRGDLLDMALPADLLRRRWWPGLVVVTAAPGRRYLPANAGHRRRAVHRERAQTALQVEQTNANDRREDHQAKKIDHRCRAPLHACGLRGRSTFESA